MANFSNFSIVRPYSRPFTGTYPRWNRGPLYKNTGAQWADAMVRGSFRIGTLYEFRDLEKHGIRGDAEEGKRSIEETFDDERLSATRFRNQFIMDLTGSTQLQNIRFAEEHDTPDCFVFCLTSDSSLDKFGDACVQIEDPAAFYEALTADLSHRGVGIAPIAYAASRVHEPGQEPAIHPALVKPMEFVIEKEVRAIWEPSTTTTELGHVILQSPAAAAFVRRIR